MRSIAIVLVLFSLQGFSQTDEVYSHYYEQVSGITDKMPKDTSRMLTELTQLVRTNPDNYLAPLTIGRIYNAEHKFDSAMHYINMAIETNGHFMSSYLSRGNSYCDSGNFAKAFKDYDLYIKSVPYSNLGYYNRGRALVLSNMKREAIDDLRASIAINDSLPNAYVLLASCYSSLGEHEKSIVYLHRAIKLGVEDAGVYGDLAFSYQALNLYAEAISNYTKSIKFDSTSFRLYANRGLAYMDSGQMGLAAADLTKAINISSEPNPDLLSTRGLIYIYGGEYDKATDDLNQALAIKDGAYYYNNLGLLFLETGFIDEALAAINKSIELDASNSHAYKNRALAYKMLGKPDLACNDIKKAKELGYINGYRNNIYELTYLICE